MYLKFESYSANVTFANVQAGLKSVLVTGDNLRAAQRIAREVGIDEVRAGVFPQDKVGIVRELQRTARVAMVGDDINDAPALM